MSSEYDRADVDIAAGTVTFGEDRYEVTGGPSTQHTYAIRINGREIGGFALMLGSCYAYTGSGTGFVEAVTAVGSVWNEQMRREQRLLPHSAMPNVRLAMNHAKTLSPWWNAGGGELWASLGTANGLRAQPSGGAVKDVDADIVVSRAVADEWLEVAVALPGWNDRPIDVHPAP